jgi:hypothetical protein
MKLRGLLAVWTARRETEPRRLAFQNSSREARASTAQAVGMASGLADWPPAIQRPSLVWDLRRTFRTFSLGSYQVAA